MIISKSKNFIFIHLEKCGGSSVEMALEPYLAWDDLILGSTQFGTTMQVALVNRYGSEYSKNKILSKHSTAQDIKEYLGESYDSMYKFTIVRNPIDLVTSLYFYSKKIVDNFLYQNNINKDQYLDWVINSVPENWKRGEIFHLNYLLSEIDNSKIDGFTKRMINSNHISVMPQTWRLTEDVEMFDISTLNENWDYITNKLNIDDIVILNKENSSPRHDNVIMSKETKRLVRKHFNVDFNWIPEKLGVEWNG
jgi:hypothetical protein